MFVVALLLFIFCLRATLIQTKIGRKESCVSWHNGNKAILKEKNTKHNYVEKIITI